MVLVDLGEGPGVDVIADFFRALPTVFAETWAFIGGVGGVLIIGAWLVLAIALAAGAILLRETHGWLSAIFGVMAGSIAFWWAFGIIPSAFVYFMDGERELLAGTIVPESLPGMDNFYQVFRDIAASGINGLFVVVFAVAFLMIQKRYPRNLAEGEERGPTSGGYK